MKIESHIKKLLARYGRVSVTGHGVFRCVSEGAKIEKGKIVPPITKVVFEECNASIDRMLVEAVMKESNIGWNEACNVINNISINIDDIVKKCDYLPQNFGLKTLDLPSVRIMPVKWLDVKYAAVIAIATMLNIMVPFNGVRNNINEAGIGLATMQKVIMPAEEAQTNDIVVEEENEIVVSEMKYVIVVASFNNQEDAMRCIIEQKVAEALEIIEKDGHFRVCGMRFTEYDEANKHIRENSLKAWVMKL